MEINLFVQNDIVKLTPSKKKQKVLGGFWFHMTGVEKLRSLLGVFGTA